MSDEYHVVVEKDDSRKILRMMTHAELKADGWEERSGFNDHMNQIWGVVDEDGQTAGKYYRWTRVNDGEIWVSDKGFPKGKIFHVDPFAEPKNPTS